MGGHLKTFLINLFDLHGNKNPRLHLNGFDPAPGVTNYNYKVTMKNFIKKKSLTFRNFIW